jgi:hypothetical protein
MQHATHHVHAFFLWDITILQFFYNKNVKFCVCPMVARWYIQNYDINIFSSLTKHKKGMFYIYEY